VERWVLEYLVVGFLLLMALAFPLGILRENLSVRRRRPQQKPPAAAAVTAPAVRVGKFCNGCHQLVDALDRYCVHCGRALYKLQPLDCPNCGSELSAFDRVCWRCGRARARIAPAPFAQSVAQLDAEGIMDGGEGALPAPERADGGEQAAAKDSAAAAARGTASPDDTH
jgi:hypothetical protein